MTHVPDKRNITRAFWGGLIVLSVLWLLAKPAILEGGGFFVLRDSMIQYTGLIAVAAMSCACLLALRPRRPERWFGGLDKMYRLHKWLGITGLVAAVAHWLWIKGAKWAVGWGWLERPARSGGRASGAQEPSLEQLFRSGRGLAEDLGEWAFYAALVLIVLALLRWFPYRLFYKTHWLLAASYLVLAFHSVVLLRFGDWASPLGVVTAVLLAAGAYAALVALPGRIGAGRQVRGTIVALQHYPGAHALEAEIAVPQGWPGHKPGQFAFATSDSTEGAHPYTIASAWDEQERHIRFVAKELGDHTGRLSSSLRVGQEVKIEGPYGCFDFDNGQPHQIWVGGGIGITPFIAGMTHLAQKRSLSSGPQAGQPQPGVDLFYTTANEDDAALAKLKALAQASGVRLHILVSQRDGRLSGERIRAAVPQWREAGIWFCGPGGFGDALRRDFAAQGLPVAQRFHQELFAMR